MKQGNHFVYGIVVLIIVCISMALGCVSSLEPVESTITDDMKRSILGRNTRVYFYPAQEHNFEHIRDFILNNSDKEKKDGFANEISKWEYRDRKYYFFVTYGDTDLPEYAKKLIFSVLDAQGNCPIEERIPHISFYTPTTAAYAEGWRNYWFLNFNTPVTEQYYSRDRLPITVKVTYPNNQYEVYHITP